MKRSRARRLLLATVLAAVLVPSIGRCGDSPLDGIRRALQMREQRLVFRLDPVERSEILLDTGRHDEAAAMVPVLLGSGVEGRIAAARVLDAVHDYDRLGALLAPWIGTAHMEEPEIRRVVYDWWVTTHDLRAVESEVTTRLEEDSTAVVDLLAAGRLRHALLDDDAAERRFERALAHAEDQEDWARALHGLARVSYRRRDFDEGLERLSASVRVDPLSPDPLMTLAHLFVRLGRIEEAIDATELVLEIAPSHLGAHYMLGNGYARKNYTQLFAAYPNAFADSTGRVAFARAERVRARSGIEAARVVLDSVRIARPGWADVWARIGSLDFEANRFAEAREAFEQALEICPEYGRAHNGIAKSIEGLRLRHDIRRTEFEERFAAAPTPDVPGIETFVLNWDRLSDRHRKRVALSIAPWRRYIPVLIEGGATYYIKPIHELLSETPEQEVLRDLRIGLDSRLWDDTRGCGGYHTVTGIEDVEETILWRYDTVLHELTHQVHRVLIPDRKRRIQELYRNAKERDEETNDAFLSRYAASSVGEYFAEGANALESPRWDAYDTREVVRERLLERDPDLAAYVRTLMEEAPVESCYAVAYVQKGYQRFEEQDPLGAAEIFRQALEQVPDEESALGALVYALQVADSSERALEVATHSTERHPSSGSSAVVHADALWLAGRGTGSAARYLEERRAEVREEDRHEVDLALGRFLWFRGEADSALRAYERVLDYQTDHPAALAGIAESHALAGRWEKAWAAYDRVLRDRSGSVPLRGALARDLLLAGEIGRAREQVEEALLLDPDDPRTRALEAWVLLEEGAADSARTAAARVLGVAPWCDLARLVKARAERERGDATAAQRTLEPWTERKEEGAPPRYVFRPDRFRYDLVGTMPAVEKRILSGERRASEAEPKEEERTG
ncbi:MAG: tetratricopeptide repeat protein [Candidatus Eisenbacteria bacterium]|nr:tetratricopeptide repeat protein [Candidatus Latescibacterota bacterium]MBD3302491.1 tetratricopeptide repeat protein [Candidatus Eisenbacteria bacterium]